MPMAITVSSTLKQQLLHWRFLDDWNWSGYLSWKDDDSRQLPIAVREARALLHVLESVGEIIANSRVDCFIDNNVVVSCWERQFPRCQPCPPS